MEPSDLPPELADVERRLVERGHPKPSADFRHRVLSALREARTPARSTWRWACLAAAVLLVLNLVMSLENHRAWPRVELKAGADLETTAREMRRRHPDLSEREAYQLALIIESPPALPASLDRIIPLEGEESWDMR